MSSNASDAGGGDGDFFALPPFKPDQALIQFKRFLRDIKTLVERGKGYAFQGVTVLELSADESVLDLRLARKLSNSPDWDNLSCRNQVEVRRAQDEIKRRLVRWADE